MDRKKARTTTGLNIKAELRRHGKTQGDAAKVLGLRSQSAVSDRLNGDVPLALDEVLQLAEWLDVPVTDLMPRAGDTYGSFNPGNPGFLPRTALDKAA